MQHYVTSAVHAIQYDGTNSAELDSNISGLSITSESGGTLVVSACFQNWTITTGQWVVHNSYCITAVMSDTDFHNSWVIIDPPAPIVALTGAGVATIPGISIIGSSVNVDVPVTPTQSSSSFTPKAYLTGASGGLTINSVTVLNASTVRVNVSASLVYVSGAQVLVTTR